MRHRIDPEALFGFVLNRWGQAVAAQVCPEVAEPERPEPYNPNADWEYHPEYEGDPYICRQCGVVKHDKPTGPHYCPERPAEPVIDEAVYEAGRAWWNALPGCEIRVLTEAHRQMIEGAVLADRELRSESCGGAAPVLAAPSTEGCRAESKPLGTGAAHAADPRLTDAEMMALFAQSYHEANTKDLRGEAFIVSRLLAVAAAQLAKADAAAKPVTISRGEIRAWWHTQIHGIDSLIDLLRSKGVEVTP